MSSYKPEVKANSSVDGRSEPGGSMQSDTEDPAGSFTSTQKRIRDVS